MSTPQFPDALVARAAEAIAERNQRAWAEPAWEDCSPATREEYIRDARAVLLAVGHELQAGALYGARDTLYRGEGPDLVADSDLVYGEWLGNRADHLAPAPANECCCEVSPPEFGGPIPDRDCPIHAPAPANAKEAGRCRVCGGIDGQHDGSVHDARAADRPSLPGNNKGGCA